MELCWIHDQIWPTWPTYHSKCQARKTQNVTWFDVGDHRSLRGPVIWVLMAMIWATWVAMVYVCLCADFSGLLVIYKLYKQILFDLLFWIETLLESLNWIQKCKGQRGSKYIQWVCVCLWISADMLIFWDRFAIWLKVLLATQTRSLLKGPFVIHWFVFQKVFRSAVYTDFRIKKESAHRRNNDVSCFELFYIVLKNLWTRDIVSIAYLVVIKEGRKKLNTQHAWKSGTRPIQAIWV